MKSSETARPMCMGGGRLLHYVLGIVLAAALACMLAFAAVPRAFAGEGDFTLSAKAAGLYVGKTTTLTPTGATGEVTWESSNPTVAAVDNGIVTGKAAGTAIVTATCGEGETVKSASCNVVVAAYSNDQEATGNYIKITNVDLSQAGKAIATYEVKIPSGITNYRQNGVFVMLDNKGVNSVTWEVIEAGDGFDQAKIMGNGVSGFYATPKAGTDYSFTIKGTYGLESGTTAPKLQFNKYTTNNNSRNCCTFDTLVGYAQPTTGISFEPASVSLELGSAKQNLTYTVAPTYYSDGPAIWVSEDDSVATVQNGYVTAKGFGTTKVWCFCGEKSASCEVKVYGGTQLKTFKFSGEQVRSIDRVATIGEDNAVAVEVPYGTSPAALIPTFTTSTGAKVLVNGVEQTSDTTANDFTNPVKYTVVSGDGSGEQTEYTVTVSVNPGTDNAFTAFDAEGAKGIIDAENHTVTLNVPFNVDMTHMTQLKPTFTVPEQAKVWIGEDEQISGTSVIDATDPSFSKTFTYTVTSANGTAQDWKVTIADPPAVGSTFQNKIDHKDGETADQIDCWFEITSIEDKTVQLRNGGTVTTSGSITENGTSAVDKATAGEITIPSTVTLRGVDYTVTALGVASLGAYNQGNACKALTAVHLPSTVTKLEAGSFGYMTALKAVDGMDNVTYIGMYCFFRSTALALSELPAGLTYIGKESFNRTNACTFWAIPASVETIESSAFFDDGNWKLSFMAFLGDTTTISATSGSFASARNLKTLVFHGDITANDLGGNYWKNAAKYGAVVYYANAADAAAGQNALATVAIKVGTAPDAGENIYADADKGYADAIPELTAGKKWTYADVVLDAAGNIVQGGYAYMEDADAPIVPTGLSATDESALGANDGAILGFSKLKTYEYQLKDYGPWIAVSGKTAVANLGAGTYLVRFPATEEQEASQTVEFTINTGTKGIQAAPEGLSAVDESAYEAKDGKITGLYAGASFEYQLKDAETWTSFTGKTEITGLAPGTYLVRFPETVSLGASPAVELTVAAYAKAEQEAPAGLVAAGETITGYADGAITGLNAALAYEYQLKDGETWTAVQAGATAIDGLAPGSYCVRLAETATLKASPAVELVVAQGAEVEGTQRVAGENRYETAANLVSNAWESADNVILATGANFPDALAASSFAGLKDAPVLLTETNELSASTLQAITKLGAKNVTIVGGESAVSADVAAALSETGVKVERLAGENRFETALKVYEAGITETGSAWSDTCIVCTARNYADALSVGPVAFAKNMPIFLVDSDGLLDEATVKAIAEGGFNNMVIVGGKSVVSYEVVEQTGIANATRLAGENRYETSAAIADFALAQGLSYLNAGVATGTNFPDGLAGAAFCGKKGSVLLLVADEGADSTLNAIDDARAGIAKCWIIGGKNAISQELAERIAGLDK